jgi:hypothetical protein
MLDFAGENSSMLRPGRIRWAEVLHDDWCGIFSGRRCHCNPVLRWRNEEDG